VAAVRLPTPFRGLSARLWYIIIIVIVIVIVSISNI